MGYRQDNWDIDRANSIHIGQVVYRLDKWDTDRTSGIQTGQVRYRQDKWDTYITSGIHTNKWDTDRIIRMKGTDIYASKTLTPCFTFYICGTVIQYVWRYDVSIVISRQLTRHYNHHNRIYVLIVI